MRARLISKARQEESHQVYIQCFSDFTICACPYRELTFVQNEGGAGDVGCVFGDGGEVSEGKAGGRVVADVAPSNAFADSGTSRRTPFERKKVWRRGVHWGEDDDGEEARKRSEEARKRGRVEQHASCY